jgi:hypothetical protein
MNKLEADAFQRTKELEQGILDEYSASQQQKGKTKSSDSRTRLMRDQLIMARAYTYLAQATNHVRLVHDLKFRIKDYQKTLADCNFDSELPRGLVFSLRPIIYSVHGLHRYLPFCCRFPRVGENLFSSLHPSSLLMFSPTIH